MNRNIILWIVEVKDLDGSNVNKLLRVYAPTMDAARAKAEKHIATIKSIRRGTVSDHPENLSL